MTDYMTQVAEILRIELKTPFKVVRVADNYQFDNYFQLTEEGLQSSYSKDCWNNKDCWKGNVSFILEGLMIGKYVIVGVSQMPRKGAYYYIPDITVKTKYSRYVWYGDKTDLEYYHLGLVCNTKKEAITLAKKMLAVAKEGKDND